METPLSPLRFLERAIEVHPHGRAVVPPRPRRHGDAFDGGWLHSCDLRTMRPDGYVQLVDRGGGREVGREPNAFVVTSGPGAEQGTEREPIAHVPREIEFIPEVPKTSTGMLHKHELRHHVSQAPRDSLTSISSTTQERKSMRQLIDISMPLQNGVVSDPPGLGPEIEYHPHAATVDSLLGFFPGATIDDLPDGEGFAFEWVRATTHNGTHLDAPYHFSAIMDGGSRAITIDEVPLEWCLQPGVKLDFRHFQDGYVATAGDVEAELARIGHELSPLEIVVVNTSAGARYGQEDYVSSGCGMGREATLYLLERGVRLTGTDGWSWDAPFVHTAERYAHTHDASLIWEGHRVGRDIGYCHLEKLHGLEQLPSTGFEISCFPVKIEAASAGWTRAVAILDSAARGRE